MSDNPIVKRMLEDLDENGPLSSLAKDKASFQASALDFLNRAHPEAPCSLVGEALDEWVSVVWQRD